jgi:hypothetical protein
LTRSISWLTTKEKAMLTVKQVGYKGAYGVFHGDKAIGQPGSQEDMEAIAQGLNTGVLPNSTRIRGRILVVTIFAFGVGALIFLGGVMQSGC